MGNFSKFWQKIKTVIFFRLQRLGFKQKIRKLQWTDFDINTKHSVLGQMTKFKPNLGQFWPKRAIFEFSHKIRKRNFLSTPETRLSTKNYKILMNGLRKKCKNLHSWAFWAKRANFGSFWPKWAKREFFSKKRLENFCRAYKP